MNAIHLLELGHLEAKSAMDAISRSYGDEKKRLFKAFRRELAAHDHIEEDIFYPSVKTHPQLQAFVARDSHAHAAVSMALAELALLQPEDLKWEPAFKAMREKLEKHFDDEESHLFVRIHEQLTFNELNELGDRMKSEKERKLNAA